MTTETMLIEVVRNEFDGELRYVRPAYGRRIAVELESLSDDATAGANLAVLVPARTDTRWFWGYCRPWEVRFLRGRVRFDGHRSGAPFPSALIVMGPLSQPGKTWHWELGVGVAV
jgi:site-specific DNA-methyltransferase (adenine-specific)